MSCEVLAVIDATPFRIGSDMVLKIEKDHQRFRQIVKGRIREDTIVHEVQSDAI
jgi:hypothetical protein